MEYSSNLLLAVGIGIEIPLASNKDFKNARAQQDLSNLLVPGGCSQRSSLTLWSPVPAPRVTPETQGPVTPGMRL